MGLWEIPSMSPFILPSPLNLLRRLLLYRELKFKWFWIYEIISGYDSIESPKGQNKKKGVRNVGLCIIITHIILYWVGRINSKWVTSQFNDGSSFIIGDLTFWIQEKVVGWKRTVVVDKLASQERNILFDQPIPFAEFDAQKWSNAYLHAFKFQ